MQIATLTISIVTLLLVLSLHGTAFKTKIADHVWAKWVADGATIAAARDELENGSR